jgi:hypothetical protein
MGNRRRHTHTNSDANRDANRYADCHFDPGSALLAVCGQMTVESRGSLQNHANGTNKYRRGEVAGLSLSVLPLALFGPLVSLSYSAAAHLGFPTFQSVRPLQ